MFIVICNILYYTGIIVAGIAVFGIVARMANVFELVFVTRNQVNKEQKVNMSI